MIADMLTKSLDRGTFAQFRNIVMNVTSLLKTEIDRAKVATHGSLSRMLDRVVGRLWC